MVKSEVRKKGYLGNPFLKKIGEDISYTPEMIIEMENCINDPIYYLETYGKIVSLDDGIVPFKLFPYQKRMIAGILGNKKVMAKIGRQLGKSAVIAGFIAWYCLFRPTKNCAILANKMATAKEIFSRVQFIIESTPKWLQQGVKDWSKTSFELENGSSCFCSATSPSAIRGQSCNLVFLDEFAFLAPNLAEEFIASVFPTISSAESTKMVIVSTPKGLNHYFRMWTEAERGINGFHLIEAHWSEHPKRSEKWADEQLKELGQLKYNQEVLCLTGDTIVTVRVNGEAKNTTLEELYRSTHNIEVLTPSGFQSFDFVTKKISSTTNRIYFDDGSSIGCTPDHVFVNGDTEIKASCIVAGDYLSGKRVSSIQRGPTNVPVYDLVNVGNGNVYITNGVVSHNCKFLGSSNTLIEGEKIGSIPQMIGEIKFPGYTEYYPPHLDQDGNCIGNYIIVVDTSRGADLDYSAFVVIDISVHPYKVSGVFRDNQIDTLLYPEVIYRVANRFNKAFVLIETNDLGQQVADILYYDLEYENVYMSTKDKVEESGYKKSPGLRTTKKTKAIGCGQLKTLIENDSIEINDFNIISEMSTFVRTGTSYKAEGEKHDDLMMCMVMFAYLTTQEVFKELFDYTLRQLFISKQMAEMNQYMEPIGFFGPNEDDTMVMTQSTGPGNYVEVTSDVWQPF